MFREIRLYGEEVEPFPSATDDDVGAEEGKLGETESADDKAAGKAFTSQELYEILGKIDEFSVKQLKQLLVDMVGRYLSCVHQHPFRLIESQLHVCQISVLLSVNLFVNCKVNLFL